MDNNPIAQLKERFSRPLDDYATRRIIFWHDKDRSFEEEFDSLNEASFRSPRTVRLAKLSNNNSFALKRSIYREHRDDDFLIYTTAEKDLSPKALEKNPLADVEIYSDHFQADFASMLQEELGAADSAVEGIRYFKTFFNAAERRQKFKRLMPNAASKSDVTIGIMSAILGATDLTTESIIKTYLLSLSSGSEPLEALGKFQADQAFATFVKQRTGYQGDLASPDDLATHLLLSALSAQLPEGSLAGLEHRFSEQHGQFCINIVQAWMADKAAEETLFDLCRRAESMCDLPNQFKDTPTSKFLDADVFPFINEVILSDLLRSMSEGADRHEETIAVSQRRKDLRWYTRVEPYFNALEQAAHIQRFQREHLQGFHYAKPSDVWNAYTTDWYLMDSLYRSFHNAFEAGKLASTDVPVSVEEGLEDLATWVERVYVNWFLEDTNSSWIAATEDQWRQTGHAEGIPRQRNFFDEFVLSGASNVKRTMVIISDALRFEVAAELRTRLEQNTNGSAKLLSMQSVFPSITEFGMAALLPHTSMKINPADGRILLDEDLPTSSTEYRESVLKKRKPRSLAIRSQRLLDARRSERKQLIGDSEFVFVYHNKIDAIGENSNTEHDVFRACDDAIDDIIALVKSARNDLGISRVIVTADHGFLYTRKPLEEYAKVSVKDAPGHVVKQGRRYMISDDINLDDPLFIKMNLEHIRGGTYTGLAPRTCIRIKKAGPGENYVHGGVSLQECCVPVIEYRNSGRGSKNFKEPSTAAFRLLPTDRRITSMVFHITLFQTEPVGGKVRPAEYDLVMVDSFDREISEVQTAHADMEMLDETERTKRIQFSLKAGVQYDSKKPYFLKCINRRTGEIWREQFQIVLAFTPMDDFGF
ncbi:MAG: BREX-1 system phosphatase PglZ type A [Actinomycetaceae bacterium]|nr:BREX-1 system phosphatase PglZ type A [Actinomycetaceae bacterium]